MKEKNPLKMLTLELPEKVFSLLRKPPEEIVQTLRVAAAAHWYERGVLPQEKALEIAGLERAEFLDAVARALQEDPSL